MATSERASSASQLSTRASIKYASRTATPGDHAASVLDGDAEVGQLRRHWSATVTRFSALTGRTSEDHLVTLATNAGQFAQRTATTPAQQTVLRNLDLRELPRFFDFTLPDNR